MKIDLTVTRKQKLFIDSTESEVLFGGAAGGGKSYGQAVDALLFALEYPGSKQLILRRTFAELDKSLIRTTLGLYPKEIYSFNSSTHTGRFKNGSLIDFGYCATENDVYQYQSAEYDVIRFDELTHFTESQYVYLLSRVRGVGNIPKQVKSSTNPGGIGHGWVKARFVDPSPYGDIFGKGSGDARSYSTDTFEEALYALAGKIRNMKDERGEPLGYTADTIILPSNNPKLESIVKKVCGSYGSLGGNYNDINLHYGNWNVIVLPSWQPSDMRIMVMSSEANKNLCGNMFFNRVPLTVTNWVDNHTGNYIWNGRCRFGVGFGTYKHIALAVDSATDVSKAEKLVF